MSDRVPQHAGVLVTAYLATVFFPYIALLPVQTDVQPYAVILATLLVVWNAGRPIPRLLYALLIPTAAAFVGTIAAHFSFYAIRGLVGYWSLFAHAAAGYLTVRRHERVVRSWMFAASWVWLAVAIAQQFITPDLTRYVVPNVSVDSDRGVSSLATEPSFYGLSCFFMLLLANAIGGESRYFRASLVLQILFLARSLMGILALAILICGRAIVKWKKSRIVIVALVLIAAGIVVGMLPEELNVRVFFLLATAIADPSALFAGDASVNARIDHIVYSVLGFIQSYGTPHGFDGFGPYVRSLMGSDPNVIWLGQDPDGMRIMSGYGGVLFEIGWFGLVIPLVLTTCAWRRFKKDPGEFIVFAVALNAVLFSAVQISLPLIGFIVGACLARAGCVGREDVATSLGQSPGVLPLGDSGGRSGFLSK